MLPRVCVRLRSCVFARACARVSLSKVFVLGSGQPCASNPELSSSVDFYAPSPSAAVPVWQVAAAGAAVGAAAACVANPADVALVRMQVNRKQKHPQTHRHTHTHIHTHTHTYTHIIVSLGWLRIWNCANKTNKNNRSTYMYIKYIKGSLALGLYG